MSAKNLDTHNRWRNKTVAFRVSPEENEQIDAAVRLSGLTKQDYITKRLLCRDVVVQGNPRVIRPCGTNWPLCWPSCGGSGTGPTWTASCWTPFG